ncbi:LOW QUALITY PROTEIN: zona pellucida sperm-binding protein 4-like [Haemorhous mexicanus]|uniref:LOW QUALITY PROTEIN: zona pellucida sperm-binding protein 4-like n=1 Tax=Haemorhous mexicanus TaxID=30427 RepID=UPI0028BDE09F|nr:LOW QUALITY PROTEIN: zona pellucida sperm-binding protein 4-like [Haemorhous mexicanus]
MGVVGWSWAASGAMLFWMFLGSLALVLGAMSMVFSDPTLLTCGQKSFQLTLPPGSEGNASFVLTTWDTEGKAHVLQNVSGCGLLASGTPEPLNSHEGGIRVVVFYLPGLELSFPTRLRVQCTYSISGSSIPLSVQVFTLPPLPAVSQPGPLSLELRVASDGSCTSYYTDSDYPVVKTLRDHVYAEVKILQGTDPDLILVLHHCWATPSPNPQQQQQWPIFGGWCPYAGDNYQTQLMPPGFTSGLLLPSHYQCFTLYTFTFVDSNSHEKLSGLYCVRCLSVEAKSSKGT